MATFNFSSALNELQSSFNFESALKETTAKQPLFSFESALKETSSELTDEEYLQRVEQLTKKPLQPAGGRTVKPLEGKISYSDLYTDDKNFFKVLDYGKARFGKEGELKSGESREDYVNRWAAHMRRSTGANLLDSTSELQYLNGADKESLLKAGEAYDLFEKTTGFLSASGQKGFKPVLDYITAAASSPDTALSLGVGKLATSSFTKAAAEKGLQAAIKSRLATLAAVPAVEATAGALGATIQEKIELNVTKAQLDKAKEMFPSLSLEEQEQVKPQLDALEARLKEGVRGSVVLTGALAATLFGSAEVAGMLKASKAVTKKPSTLEDVLKPYKKSTETVPPKITVKAEDPTEKILEDQYDIFEGRKLLNKEGEPTSVAEMQIRNDVNKKAAEIASGIWQRLPDLAPQPNQKISDAVKNVFLNIDNIDDIVLRDALASADVTPEEFARMNRTTAGDAGRTLQAYSVLARIQNKLKAIDPAAAKEVDLMYGGRNTLTTAFTGLRDLSMRLDRELKALMVSQLSTTIRNAFSGAAVVTFGAASEAVESSLYRMGKTVGELSSGKPITGSFTGGLKGVYDDAVRTAFYLGQKDLSAETAEQLLAGSPALKNRILRTIGEEGDNNLSKVARIANTFNVAQDAFFRQAIFTASVEKQLSRVGLDMYDLLANNKTIPFDVLRNATDEALAATFSKMPTKGPAFHAIKFIEELGPIGSTIIPFPRFMANAMSWTYKHSPMGALSGTADVAKGATLLARGSEEGQRYLMEGLENISKGAVGTAAIYAAYKYREQHQDTNWYDIKNPDGSLVDARAFFPLSPFLAIGDYLVKFKKDRTDEFKTKELVESLTGFKAPAGTYSWLGDKFAEASSNAQTGEAAAEKKVSQFFGEWVGEYLGRAFVPIQQLSDIIGAIDRDETLPRDAYQIKPGEEGFTTSAKQQLMKRIPVVKQQLPISQPALKEEAIYNDAGPLKVLTGIAIKGNPTPLENEVTKLKVDFNKIFTSTGDKIVDANAKKVMAPLAIQTFTSIKDQPFYADASQDMQKIILQNTLQWAQKTAKEIATSTDEAAAFNEGRQPRLFEIRYSALPPEVRRVTAETYKANTGKDLLDTKDYLTALAYAAALRKIPGFAFGGLVGRGVGTALKTGARKSSAELMQEMQQATATKTALSKTSPLPLQDVLPPPSSYSLQTKPTPLQPTKTVDIPAEPPAKKLPITAEETVFRAESDEIPWWEYEPPAASKLDIVATKQTNTPDEFISAWDTNKTDKEFLQEWNKNFPTASNEELLSAWKKKNDKYLSDYSAMLSKLEDEGIEVYDAEGNLINTYKAKSIKSYPEGTTKEQIEAAIANEKKVNDVYKSMAEEAAQEIPPQRRQRDFMYYENALSGDLDRKVPMTSTKRKDALQTIKEVRGIIFDEVRANGAFKNFDDVVIGTAVGDWRFKTGSELNITDEQMMKQFYDMTSSLQNKYNRMKKEYADMPDIKLWHGSFKPEDTKTFLREGFTNPQLLKNTEHVELRIGGTSFTTDLNMNFKDESFGGLHPDRYVYTTLPYSDYMFSRINMPPMAYDEKNLNVLARAITGAPDVVRPVGLPRSGGLKETEDVFVESEKFKPRPKMGQLPLFSGKAEVEAMLGRETKAGSVFEAKGKPVPAGGGDLITKIQQNMRNVGDSVDAVAAAKDEKESKRLAYMTYSYVRTALNSLREYATFTSAGSGIGQTYHRSLNLLSNTVSGKEANLKKVADILNKAGAKEKASLLLKVDAQLKKMGGDDMAPEIKAVQEVQKLTPKLNRGGFISRKTSE